MKFVVFWDFFGVINTGEPVVAELLEQVTVAGGVNVLVSYSSIQIINEHLDDYSLTPHFDEIYDAERVIELGDTKSGAISDYLSSHNHEMAKVVIGDSLTDVQAAQEVGAVSWLFDPHLTFRDGVGGADAVVHQLIELKELLRSLIEASSDGGYTVH